MTIGYSFIDITGISNQIDFTATEIEVLWEKNESITISK